MPATLTLEVGAEVAAEDTDSVAEMLDVVELLSAELLPLTTWMLCQLPVISPYVYESAGL